MNRQYCSAFFYLAWKFQIDIFSSSRRIKCTKESHIIWNRLKKIEKDKRKRRITKKKNRTKQKDLPLKSEEWSIHYHSRTDMITIDNALRTSDTKKPTVQVSFWLNDELPKNCVLELSVKRLILIYLPYQNFNMLSVKI